MKIEKFYKIELKLLSLLILFSIFMCFSCDKVVSVSPPDAPPPNGFLFISSYPEGARIYLNGKARRRATPDSLTWLKTGTDTITLKKDYFRDTSIIVNPVEGEKHSFFVDYSKNTRMLGKINCTSLPTNASIFLDDSSTSLKTPATLGKLLPGNHKISYKYKDHRDNTLDLIVRSDSTTDAYGILVDTTVWKDYNTGNSMIITNKLSCIACDNDNKLWIGTTANGIMIYNGLSWLHYSAVGGMTLPNNDVICITIPQTNIKWVGTKVGLAIYYGDGPTAHTVDTTAIRAITYFNNSIAYPSNNHVNLLTSTSNSALSPDPFEYGKDIITAIVHSKNYLWIGTKKSGIAYYLVDEWKYITQTSSGVLSNSISTMTTDNSENIFVGYPAGTAIGNGISFYNGNSWQVYYILPSGASTNSLYVDSKNRLWVGTNKGLVEKDGETVTQFNFDNTGLNITNVSGAVEDKSGNIWITTSDAGLFKYKGAH